MRVGNGSVLNQYKILAPIGKGGMGEVFLAEDTKLDRKVALKILPAEFAANADRMNHATARYWLGGNCCQSA